MRSRIRSIRISLNGMVAGESIGPPQEGTSEVPHGFSLSSTVTPENLGKLATLASTPVTLPAPENVRAVAGHCRGALVIWDSDIPTTSIRGFAVRYWPKGSTSTASTKGMPYPSILPSGVDRHQHCFL